MQEDIIIEVINRGASVASPILKQEIRLWKEELTILQNYKKNIKEK